jgi:hypothetical protein
MSTVDHISLHFQTHQMLKSERPLMKNTVNIPEVIGLVLRINAAGLPRRLNQIANVISNYKNDWCGQVEGLQENNIPRLVLNYRESDKMKCYKVGKGYFFYEL